MGVCVCHTHHTELINADITLVTTTINQYTEFFLVFLLDSRRNLYMKLSTELHKENDTLKNNGLIIAA